LADDQAHFSGTAHRRYTIALRLKVASELSAGNGFIFDYEDVMSLHKGYSYYYAKLV
jgi:hypothetical protein